MQHHSERNTICISSQAGCAYACAFCSTGQAGFTRHLSATEIFDQARYWARHLAQQGRKVTNVVFMGMGEPFHNYGSVMDAVRLLNDPNGFGLGHRHITISTVGVVPQIDQFADEGIQVNLAISLHAPTDEVRSSIMPVNKKWPVAELMAAVERYITKSKRKVFFEYVMLDGVNDRPARRAGAGAADARPALSRQHHSVQRDPRCEARCHRRRAHPRVHRDPGGEGHRLHGAHPHGPRHRRRLRPTPSRNPTPRPRRIGAHWTFWS